MSCRHETWTTIETSAYTGAVSRDENLSAHGNVSDTEECRACGARRRVNINQWHREEGSWRGSRLARSERLARLEREVCELREQARTAGADVVRSDGERARVEVDRAGMLLVTPCLADADDAARAVPATLACATRLRQACIDLDRARAAA